jgi:hypothetical protein
MSPLKDPDKLREYRKHYYLTHKEEILLRSKRTYEKIKNDPSIHEKHIAERRNKYWANAKQRREQANLYNNNELRKQKRSDYAKKWNKEHLEEQTKKRRYRRQNCKIKVISHYSKGTMTCCKCGTDDMRILTIDHINGKGNEHRKQIHRHLAEWVVRNNYPDGFQILCIKCQWIKRVENGEEN